MCMSSPPAHGSPPEPSCRNGRDAGGYRFQNGMVTITSRNARDEDRSSAGDAFSLRSSSRRRVLLRPRVITINGTDPAWSRRHPALAIGIPSLEVRPMLNRKLSLVLGIALVLGAAGCQRETTTSSTTQPPASASSSSTTPSPPASSSSSSMAPSTPSTSSSSSSSEPPSGAASSSSATPPKDTGTPSSGAPSAEPKKDKGG